MVQHVLHMLLTTATVIGCVVMFAWLVLIVWFVSIMLGEFRFNRILKRRAERDFEDLRSSWLAETRESQFDSIDGSDRFHTAELDIGFQFHPREDDFETEITGSVFDIRERYPNEFA